MPNEHGHIIVPKNMHYEFLKLVITAFQDNPKIREHNDAAVHIAGILTYMIKPGVFKKLYREFQKPCYNWDTERTRNAAKLCMFVCGYMPEYRHIDYFMQTGQWAYARMYVDMGEYDTSKEVYEKLAKNFRIYAETITQIRDSTPDIDRFEQLIGGMDLH